MDGSDRTRHGLYRRRVLLRRALTNGLQVALLLALTGCTSTPSAPDDRGRDGPVRDGTVPWDDALLLPGDPTLITVRFTAGPEGPPTNPCADRFRIDADERDDSVRLTVREVPHATSGSGVACALGGVRRYATVDLDQPLGARRLVDGSRGERRSAVDGTRDPGRAAVRTAARSTGDAQVAGTLRADPRSGCLWVEDAGGRIPVLLAHPRYSVRLDSAPPAVVDDDNAVIDAGRAVRISGARGSGTDAVPGCAVPGPPFIGVLAR